jgi:hypothetical protein
MAQSRARDNFFAKRTNPHCRGANPTHVFYCSWGAVFFGTPLEAPARPSNAEATKKPPLTPDPSTVRAFVISIPAHKPPELDEHI